ncbi:MAG: hypothetical protein ACOC1Z_05420 [Cyanobacteriota bacterium]
MPLEIGGGDSRRIIRKKLNPLFWEPCEIIEPPIVRDRAIEKITQLNSDSNSIPIP